MLAKQILCLRYLPLIVNNVDSFIESQEHTYYLSKILVYVFKNVKNKNKNSLICNAESCLWSHILRSVYVVSCIFLLNKKKKRNIKFFVTYLTFFTEWFLLILFILFVIFRLRKHHRWQLFDIDNLRAVLLHAVTLERMKKDTKYNFNKWLRYKYNIIVCFKKILLSEIIFVTLTFSFNILIDNKYIIT